ncbi:MAG: FtsX-like permease family protein [Candidatus Acidiferrum sp.]
MTRRKRMLQELDEDIRDHLDRETQDNIERGMTPEEARYAALRKFGNVTCVKEETREVWSFVWLEQLLQDIRLGFRMLRRSPGFTTVAILTLALGIGANSAIFAVIENVLLKPLPFPDSAQLVDLGHDVPGIGLHGRSASFLYFTYADQSRSFQSVGLWRENSNSLTGLAEPEHVRSLELTSEVLPIVGVQPLLGRLFSAADAAPGAPLTAMLAYGLWRAKFSSDASVIGHNIIIDGLPRQVIGVLPRNFWFMDSKAAVVLPLQFDRSKTILGNFSYSGIARLNPGVPLAQASADCARLIPVAARSFPLFPGLSLASFERWRITPAFTSLKASVLGDIGGVLWVLMGTTGLVLLIACANVANLMLVRTQGRQQELAIRSALGAGWWQIARELLLESLVLGVVGDERADGVDKPAPKTVYWPLLMDHFGPEPLYATPDVSYVVRTPRAGSSALMQEISQAVWSVSKELPLANPQTLEDLYNKSLARTSFALVMLGIAGAMAFALGVAGLYGVISYSVAQRTREIGIRVAIGAQHSTVRRMFIAEGARLAAIGIAVGSVAALGLMRLMHSLLFGVKPIDPLTYAGVAAALAAAAAMASYIPAMRATKVDPVDALRAE